MNGERLALVQRLIEQERARTRQGTATPGAQEPACTHYTQLAEDTSGGPLAREWNVYCREVARLLTEGNEGRHVLIKGDDIIGVFDDWDGARAAGLERFLRQPFFVHAIRTTEPHLRIRGINYPWPNCNSPLAEPD